MSQFYDQASLVVVPSGYKAGTVYAQKPLTTDGQLAFTRTGDTATRINSAGLIEKVRTNLLLQSNTFSNAAWLKQDISLTSGQIGYDGTTNAWKLTPNTSNFAHYAYQNIVTTGLLTFSVYAKPDGYNFILLYAGGYGGTFFDISTGTIGGNLGSAPSATKIEAAGNGFYRCSITVPSSADVAVFAANTISNYIFAGNGTSGVLIQSAQHETGDIATAYIPTTTAAVSVGPVANVPRLDYLGSTCPRLLLEPQRTNLVTYSEQINNAAWTKSAGGTGIVPVVTANDTTSPDGYQNADKVVFNSGAGTTGTDQSMIDSVGFSVTNGTTYTGSFWARGAVGGEQLAFRHVGGFTKITLTTSWQRYTLTTTAGYTGTGYFTVGIRRGLVEPLNSSATVFIWGAQLEVGAYATSYIPTLAASATRGFDFAYKTGISSLIGQTEGTVFWELDVKIPNAPANESTVNIDNGAFGDTIYLYKSAGGQLSSEIYVSGVVQASFATSTISAGKYKLALAYANNNSAFFVNGVQVGSTDTSCSIPATSRIQMGATAISNDTSTTEQVLIFKTRLSNAQLAELTAL